MSKHQGIVEPELEDWLQFAQSDDSGHGWVGPVPPYPLKPFLLKACRALQHYRSVEVQRVEREVRVEHEIQVEFGGLGVVLNIMPEQTLCSLDEAKAAARRVINKMFYARVRLAEGDTQ